MDHWQIIHTYGESRSPTLGWPQTTNNDHLDLHPRDIYPAVLMRLFPIMLAVDIWGNQLANSCVMFLTDNQALVSIINSQSCKSSQIMKLVRHLVLKCMQFNIHFKAKHIPGKHNVLADLLSRSRLQDARAHAPWLEQIDTQIPDHLAPSTGWFKKTNFESCFSSIKSEIIQKTFTEVPIMYEYIYFYYISHKCIQSIQSMWKSYRWLFLS